MAQKTMQAIRYHENGSADVLKMEQIPVPEPKEGEVLVRVHAAGVNPVDWKQRRGSNTNFPATPGIDLSGEVEAVGPGVDTLAPGQAVWGAGQGAYAEYAIAPASSLVPKPEGLSYEEAATLGIGTRTAWAALFEAADLRQGQRLLVQGAAGGVGMWGVQLGKWKGARIIGTASTSNIEYIKSLGVDEPVDYTKTKVESAVKDIDIVLDTVGGKAQDQSWPTLKKGGLLVTIVGSPDEEQAKRHGVRAMRVGRPTDSHMIFTTVNELLRSGAAKPLVQTVFPFDQARQAQELCETGHGRGRIVLKIAD